MSAGAVALGAAAIASAIKASGVLVCVDPPEFQKILARVKGALIVTAEGGFFGAKFQYLVSYKGLTFFSKSDEPLALPADAEVVRAGRIWVPG